VKEQIDLYEAGKINWEVDWGTKWTRGCHNEP